MSYTPTGSGIKYTPETPAENIDYYMDPDRLGFKVMNPRGDVRALETGNTTNNVPTQSSSISMRPRGL